jgi:hypothetical protein
MTPAPFRTVVFDHDVVSVDSEVLGLRSLHHAPHEFEDADLGGLAFREVC